MSYALILFMYAHGGPTLSSTPGFKNPESCAIAAEKAKEAFKGYGPLKAVCVKQE